MLPDVSFSFIMSKLYSRSSADIMLLRLTSISLLRFQLCQSERALRVHHVWERLRTDRRGGEQLKGHCIEFKYYANGIHSGLTPPG